MTGIAEAKQRLQCYASHRIAESMDKLSDTEYERMNGIVKGDERRAGAGGAIYHK